MVSPPRISSSTMESFPVPTFLRTAAVAPAGIASSVVSSSTSSSLPLASRLKSRCFPLIMVSTSNWVTPFLYLFADVLDFRAFQFGLDRLLCLCGEVLQCQFLLRQSRAEQ